MKGSILSFLLLLSHATVITFLSILVLFTIVLFYSFSFF